ncbi:hypothetical protein [Pseudarthrobacter oxydans]|uniref:hypothetical protein n=1 Tax=Pseudarthrobacter oxydans TaxID=1671 RepID=UPI002AA90992|nr:hypothetical protein [Pseudarthrobacter oxydans]WPU08089.1 hypothetical protein SMD14_13035 [Pseudarthrobacter oxydans]
MNETDRQAGEAFASLLSQMEDRAAAMEELHRQLKQRGLLANVTLHKYMCKRGCQIATAFMAGGMILCAVRDYKYSPGLNEQASVPAARERNTLDGDRHWPGHVYDVAQLEQFSVGANKSGMSMNCRHHRGTVLAETVLRDCAGVTPGKPGAPTRL